jgi:DNA-binding NarL/FixJ family response regulator
MPSISDAETIGVLVADSNQMQCQLLARALRRRREFRVAACGGEMEAILSALSSARVHVVILNTDHARGGWEDMSTLRRLHLTHPEVAKVLLIDAHDRDLVVSAFRSGVRGLFCFADYPFRLLCKCIQSVHAGQIWANTQQMQQLVEAVSQVASLRVVNANGRELLTPREAQVVALVADGLANREIAAELQLSEHTVKKYVFRIFEKLGISSRVELVLYAVNHGGHLQAEWMAGSSAA